MNGFTLHTSNQLESLADVLAERLRSPLASPLATEVVVVQSRGVRRWLSFALAERAGVCMNCAFPFPRTFLEEVLRAWFPELAAEGEFSADTMTWRIFQKLPALLDTPGFEPVRHYAADGGALKLFQLASRVAGLFDQYLVYRPDMLRGWEENGAQDWQARLWRELVAATEGWSLAAVHGEFSSRMAAPPADGSRLPERVWLFGITSLPPYYMEMFLRLSRHLPVELFTLRPSREYLGDMPTPKQRARQALPDAADGNPLLASLGRLAVDFTDVLFEADERAGHVMCDGAEAFVEPEGRTLLAQLQRDLFTATKPEERRPVADDASLEIHACHSRLREMEVLQDYLLALFQKDPSLRPRDVLVMTPEIEDCAPFVEAVFATPEDPRRRIPFSIADRPPRSGSTAVATFLRLLELPGSRCTTPEIFELLETPLLRASFGFDDDGLARIRRWLEESGIRWGMDAAHREACGVPAFEAASWRHGLRRLLLGYAMPAQGARMWEGILPVDDVEGDGADVLGRLLSAVEALFALARGLSAERSLAEWPRELERLMAPLFTGETEGELNVREALEALAALAARMEKGAPVPFDVVRKWLGGQFAEGQSRGGFLTGGVTFCAMKPLRSVPARVVCLVGLDDGKFPRIVRAPGFDLMEKNRLRGDRSPRDDDRAIFLEALLAARERVFISHVGRSQRDNSEIPPSALVSELCDYLDEAFAFPTGGSRKLLTRNHRLHAFSPAYFDGSDARLFSHSTANAAAARALSQPVEGRGFVNGILPPPPAEARAFTLRGLLDFFKNPAATFLRVRFGMDLRDFGSELEESEPFELDHLQRYGIRQEVVARALAGPPLERAELAARGKLPEGGLGASHFESLRQEAEDFSEKLARELAGAAPDVPLLVALVAGGFSLTGQLDSVFDGRGIHYRCAKLKPKDQLVAWLHHLVHCAVKPGAEVRTTLLAKDGLMDFTPVPDALERLADLLEVAWEGLSRPVHFFPQSSLKWMEAAGDPKKDPAKAARKEWDGNEQQGFDGEKDEESIAVCFGDSDPLDAEFEALAKRVLGPMLAHREVRK